MLSRFYLLDGSTHDVDVRDTKQLQDMLNNAANFVALVDEENYDDEYTFYNLNQIVKITTHKA
jgi:hypothetical protein